MKITRLTAVIGSAAVVATTSLIAMAFNSPVNGPTDVNSAAGTLIMEMAHKNSSYTFDQTTDSLEALRDKIDTIPTTAMRGTDNAQLASTALTQYNTLNGKIDTIDTNVDTINTNTTGIRGTTFNTTTDSLEAIRNNQDAFKGATFNASTDSLEAIRDAITASAGGTPTSWTCTVVSNSYTIPINSLGSVTASCSGSAKVISGGCSTNNIDTYSYTIGYPSNQGWDCLSRALGSQAIVYAYANCCS